MKSYVTCEAANHSTNGPGKVYQVLCPNFQLGCHSFVLIEIWLEWF